jgi:hypothetical protein
MVGTVYINTRYSVLERRNIDKYLLQTFKREIINFLAYFGTTGTYSTRNKREKYTIYTEIDQRPY